MKTTITIENTSDLGILVETYLSLKGEIEVIEAKAKKSMAPAQAKIVEIQKTAVAALGEKKKKQDEILAVVKTFMMASEEKAFMFPVGSITSRTKKVYTVPDKDITLAGLEELGLPEYIRTKKEIKMTEIKELKAEVLQDIGVDVKDDLDIWIKAA